MKDQNNSDQSDRVWLGDLEGFAITDPLTEALDRIYAEGPGTEVVRQAITRLDDVIGQRTGPEVSYADIPRSPIGRIFIAASALGVIAVAFGLGEDEFKHQLRKQGFDHIVGSTKITRTAIRQISEYLDGKRTQLNLPTDLSRLTPFQRDVLNATAGIPRGQVSTYADIARRLGRPKSSRAVGQALGSNPVPIVIPCHRVIASNGSLGGYSGGGGVRSKAFLLQLEGALLNGM
jgi:methylated-DNA-[protein]-cysteine S-methyltransferase